MWRNYSQTLQKKQNWAYLWISIEEFYAVCFYCMPSSQPAFTCSKLTIETVEQIVKYVQSQQ